MPGKRRRDRVLRGGLPSTLPANVITYSGIPLVVNGIYVTFTH